MWVYLRFIYIFNWVLTSLSTHGIGHITTGRFIYIFYLDFNVAFNTLYRSYHDGYFWFFMGRGNQYIQLINVLYCKLPTNGKQLPAFPLEGGLRTKLQSQRWKAGSTLEKANPVQSQSKRFISLSLTSMVILGLVLNITTC